MKFLGFLGRMISWMVFIAFCAVIVAFFVAVSNPEGVINVIEIVKELLKGGGAFVGFG